MTKDEQDAMVTASLRKFQELRKQESCLRARLRKALEVLGPAQNADWTSVEDLPDHNPCDDARELAEVRRQKAECREFLTEQGLGEFVDRH